MELRMRSLVCMLMSGIATVAAAQPRASDYHSLTSVGLLAGAITGAEETHPFLGATLGVDRRVRPAAAVRFQADAALNLSTSELAICPPPDPCTAKERIEFAVMGLIGPEFGRREAGVVTPFGGAQVGFHVSGVTRPATGGGVVFDEDASEKGVAGGVYLGLRTGQQAKHFRGSVSYTRLGGSAGAGIVGVRVGVEW